MGPSHFIDSCISEMKNLKYIELEGKCNVHCNPILVNMVLIYTFKACPNLFCSNLGGVKIPLACNQAQSESSYQ